MLQKLCKQLWAKFFVIESPDQVDERCEVLHLLKEIPDYEETDELGVDESLSTDYEGEQITLRIRNCFSIHTQF